MPTELTAVPDTAPLTRSLSEQIAARLSERIVSGVYAPGQRIMEQAVADEFAVSRGPVREALRLQLPHRTRNLRLDLDSRHLGSSPV